MIIVIKLINQFGEFVSEEMSVTVEEFKNLKEFAKNFYAGGGYEMYLPTGFLVVPPDIVKQSILILDIISDEDKS